MNTFAKKSFVGNNALGLRQLINALVNVNIESVYFSDCCRCLHLGK